MLKFIAEHAYVFWVLVILFLFLYLMGGDDIIFFRRKKYPQDPKAGEKLKNAVERFAVRRDYKVLGPITLEREGERYSFDAVMLGLWGTVAFKAAPRAGEIYADTDSDGWLQVFEGEREYFPDPLKELTGVGKFFRELYRAEGVKYGKTDALVVFTRNNTSVAVSRFSPVCHISDLSAKLEKNYLSDNGARIDRMREALEKYRVSG